MIYVRPKTEFQWWEKLIIENAIKLEKLDQEELTIVEILSVLLPHLKPNAVKSRVFRVKADEKRLERKKELKQNNL